MGATLYKVKVISKTRTPRWHSLCHSLQVARDRYKSTGLYSLYLCSWKALIIPAFRARELKHACLFVMSVPLAGITNQAQPWVPKILT